MPRKWMNPRVLVPLEGLEPPTLSLGRNCSSIELQRLTGRVYRTRASSSLPREPVPPRAATTTATNHVPFKEPRCSVVL
jgi:hypothetical protein